MSDRAIALYLSVTTNVVGLQTDDAGHVDQNSSAHEMSKKAIKKFAGQKSTPSEKETVPTYGAGLMIPRNTTLHFILSW